jgi:hypothetical protein
VAFGKRARGEPPKRESFGPIAARMQSSICGETGSSWTARALRRSALPVAAANGFSSLAPQGPVVAEKEGYPGESLSGPALLPRARRTCRRGPEGSNPVPSTGESAANLTSVSLRDKDRSARSSQVQDVIEATLIKPRWAQLPRPPIAGLGPLLDIGMSRSVG